MEKKVLVPIADGIEEIEVVTIIDVLRRAGASVTVAGVSNRKITASRGVTIISDIHISRCTGERYDMIALPGGMPGAENLRDAMALTIMLKNQKAQGRWIAAICAAPAIVLSHHGFLTGRKATCHPNFTNLLDQTTLSLSRVVVDGPFITSQGPGTALEFALELVSVLYGKKKAADVALPLVLA